MVGGLRYELHHLRVSLTDPTATRPSNYGPMHSGYLVVLGPIPCPSMPSVPNLSSQSLKALRFEIDLCHQTH